LVEDDFGSIYAGTNTGVFRSEDFGSTWTFLGMPDGYGVSALGYDDHGYLYAGMMAGGIYRSRFPVRGDIPTQHRLPQNFPNPFNSGTAILVQLIQEEHVNLSVFDMLGRFITTLVDRPMPPGDHIVPWNPQSLPSGVYFCRLVAGTAKISRKMIYLR
jgi:hypothetical protein